MPGDEGRIEDMSSAELRDRKEALESALVVGDMALRFPPPYWTAEEFLAFAQRLARVRLAVWGIEREFWRRAVVSVRRNPWALVPVCK